MTTRWMSALVTMAICLPVWGQSKLQGNFTLTTQQVARTLSDNGIQTVEEQVSLLAKVVATEPSPLLDVLSVTPLGDRSPGKQHSEAHSLVKLACRVPGVCLPFYSIVDRSEAKADNTPNLLSAGTGITMLKSNTAIIMRTGAHATLVMDDARSHIQVTVISLENGIAGHKIHVTTPDHKQVYIAEVISANVVKGSF